MKKTFNLLAIVAAAVIVILIAACLSGTDNNEGGPGQYIGVTLMFNGHQVWERTYTETLSEIRQKFSGSREITAIVPLSRYDNDTRKIGSGEIRDGFLSFSVGEPGSEDLLQEGEDLLFFIFRDFSPETVNIYPPDVRSNAVIFVTDQNELLSWEMFTGTNYPLGGEYVWFVYADRDAVITSNNIDHKALHLSLKQGWNVICKRETHSTAIKKHDFKWAVVDINLRYKDLSESIRRILGQ